MICRVKKEIMVWMTARTQSVHTQMLFLSWIRLYIMPIQYSFYINIDITHFSCAIFIFSENEIN